MPYLSEDDVIIYGEGTFKVPSDAIVHHHDASGYHVKAWRHNSKQTPIWSEARPHVVSAQIDNGLQPRPHPDADRVWADYCAWTLTGE
jgi:hypothetical protein